MTLALGLLLTFFLAMKLQKNPKYLCILVLTSPLVILLFPVIIFITKVLLLTIDNSSYSHLLFSNCLFYKLLVWTEYPRIRILHCLYLRSIGILGSSVWPKITDRKASLLPIYFRQSSGSRLAVFREAYGSHYSHQVGVKLYFVCHCAV